MRFLKELLVLFPMMGMIFLGNSTPVEASRTVRCESQGNGRKTCSIGIHGHVSLARQLSRSACIEGQTWGDEPDGIWVSGGCRAEFRIDDIPNYTPDWNNGATPGGGNSYGGSTAASGPTTLCESRGNGRNYCPGYTANGIHLVRQLSRSACVYQRTWGYDSGGIWVSGGCRAEFAADQPHYYGGSNSSTRPNTLRCGSEGGKHKHCTADTRGGVSLARQLSRSACVEGSTWGYDTTGIWVSDGCRGEFQLHSSGYLEGNHHGNHHDHTAEIAAGALVLGALVAVAASGNKDGKSPDSHSLTGNNPDAETACREAVAHKIRDHYGKHASFDPSGMDQVDSSGKMTVVTGKGKVKLKGRSWPIVSICSFDRTTHTVKEVHIQD